MLNPWHNGARPQYEQYSGGRAGSMWRASLMLNKDVIHVPWNYDSHPYNGPVVNCSAPNIDKGCTDPPVQCDNDRCFYDNTPLFYDSLGAGGLNISSSSSSSSGGGWGGGMVSQGADWMAAGGVSPDNLRAWSQVQHGRSNALGVMTTQWNSRNPDTSGIPQAGQYGWNRAQAQRTSKCATPE